MLKQIASFMVDHRKLKKGMYISRIDGDVITYDIRMKQPNIEAVLEVPTSHTVEHLLATYARNSKWEAKMLYVGPMGCRTGFYLLLRSDNRGEALQIARFCFESITKHTGLIPGASDAECGNWKDHDLPGAKKEAMLFLPILASWSERQLDYEA